MGMSRAAAVTTPAEAPPVWHILNLLPGLDRRRNYRSKARR